MGALNVLSEDLVMLNRVQEAQREIEEALRLNARDTRILCTAGDIHNRVNRPDLAEREFRTALEQNPQNFAAYARISTGRKGARRSSSGRCSG
jgi:Flp pilus assembly protein TadD